MHKVSPQARVTHRRVDGVSPRVTSCFRMEPQFLPLQEVLVFGLNLGGYHPHFVWKSVLLRVY